MPNTTIAEFANTVDPDETAHNERFHLDQIYSVCPLVFDFSTSVYIEFFFKFCGHNFVVCFLALYELYIFTLGDYPGYNGSRKRLTMFECQPFCSVNTPMQ